jgi:hypothetical protein
MCLKGTLRLVGYFARVRLVGLKNEISAIMPPKRRAQAFSGKKKKEQLQQKRKLSKSTVPSHAGQLKLS